MIQAVPWEGGLAMLKECFRVLAPGGKLRIVAANLAKFVSIIKSGCRCAADHSCETSTAGLAQNARGGD